MLPLGINPTVNLFVTIIRPNCNADIFLDFPFIHNVDERTSFLFTKQLLLLTLLTIS